LRINSKEPGRSWSEMKKLIYPNGVFSIRLDEKVGRKDVVYGVSGFVFRGKHRESRWHFTQTFSQAEVFANYTNVALAC
jgi:hypothetical protein